VKVCPRCAEELSDEATICSRCHNHPAVAPAWAAPRPPKESSPGRLGNVWGPDGSLPTSDRVPAPFKRLEPAGALGIPSKVWVSLILAFVWGFAAGTIADLTGAILPRGVGLTLHAAGFITGLILGISGLAEVGSSDRLGRIVARLAIAVNGFNLAWIVMWAIQYGLVVRG